MRPVYQNRFGYGAGNCAWACVASLFELELDSLPAKPPAALDMLEWSKEALPHLKFNNRDLGYNYRIEEGYPDAEGVGTGRWTYDLPDAWDPPTDGYWLASVNSLGLKRPVEDPYYPRPALHMVVMHGRRLVHDPNPRYAVLLPYRPVVVEQTWWT